MYAPNGPELNKTKLKPKIKGLVKAEVNNVTFSDIVGYTVDNKVYYVSEDAYVAVNGRPTSVWDGTRYLDEYTEITNENAEAFITAFEALTDLKVNLETKTVTVSSAKALASLDLLEKYFSAKSVLNDDRWLTGINVCVEVDIDLNGKQWTSLGGEYQVDFKDHTVFNLNCKTTEKYAGLFKFCGVSNLKLDHAVVDGNEFVGAVTAWRQSRNDKNGTINLKFENITVSNSTVSGCKYVGGIVGQSYKNITGCSLVDSNVVGKTGNADGDKQIGGIVGSLAGNAVTDCEVSKCTIEGPLEVGGIAGRAWDSSGLKFAITGNRVTNGTVIKPLDGNPPTDFIGNGEKYIGLICGGNLLSGHDGYFYNKDAETNTIKTNTVENLTEDGWKNKK